MLDVSGPPERTGKARGTDLLDGTVTLPLIAAAEADPSIRDVDLRALDAAAAETLCDRIAATGALDRVRTRALAMVAKQAKGDARAAAARSTPRAAPRCSSSSPTASCQRYMPSLGSRRR